MTVDVAPQAGVTRGGNPQGQDSTGTSAVDSFGSALVSLDSRKPAYSYSLSAFSPFTAPTAIVVIQGSATKTLRIREIGITGAATAAGNMPVVITRRSTAGTVGSAVLTAITSAKHDTSDAAATATVSSVGTANYTTLGTTAGQIAAGRVAMTALGTGVGIQPLVFSWAQSGKAIVVRGTSDYVTIELAGAAIPSGGVLDLWIKIDEDAS